MKIFRLSDKKEFMNQLLRNGIFDNFLLSEASVHMAVDYHVDGRINKAFYSEEESAENHLDGLDYMPYGRLRPFFFGLIKGRHTPSFFRFVLMLSPANMRNTILAADTTVSPEDISAVFFNISYQNGDLLLTTGISYHTFILDKSFEKEWDRLTMSFLLKNRINFSEI